MDKIAPASLRAQTRLCPPGWGAVEIDDCGTTTDTAAELERKGAGTRVTWAMYGPQPYVAKVLHLVFDVDRMVGGQFEEGLANLKTLTEN